MSEPLPYADPDIPRVELVPYDSSWPRRFEAEAVRLRSALGDLAVSIDHVGSTAVLGLAAKPIIDAQVTVRQMQPADAYVRPLEALGYVYRPDSDQPDHDFFCLNDRGIRTVNLNVCKPGSTWERDPIAFRDRLRSDPQLAAAYLRLKFELAQRFPEQVYAYAEGKSEFIRRVLTSIPP